MDGAGLRLAGAVTVVTGGGSGIGAALARRFAERGAVVVVNDVDADAARAVAERVGGVALPGDAGDPAAVAQLVATVWERYGGLDLFCANAGVAADDSIGDPDAAWELSWRVNVMAHVYAARALLPRWLDAGRGRLLVTASAAGLLTMLGGAPYAVTKHAAIGYAEWLRATYHHRGVTVQALCPQGVRTPMLDRAGRAGAALLEPDAIGADDVADRVEEALAGDRFLVLPHAEVAEHYRRRATDTDRWLRAMNGIQRSLEAPDQKGDPGPV
ncbi:SDR family oxidoreductase [Phytohabitans houttuyneae]|uniref:Oxidoreductase n=1 Tax=Phytohabitans houttuyneae TaxID=1076126 RepID=A0A6V8KU48_9ACTN|nr:SDR family oxidoreductase [Phytohabitans houttuyneae]GFJ85861.1 oxidoreductase [Phytohabitans houttuyneae]